MTGVECHYDEEQDPPVISCIWHYNLGPGTEPASLQGDSTSGTVVGDTLTDLADEADLEFV